MTLCKNVISEIYRRRGSNVDLMHADTPLPWTDVFPKHCPVDLLGFIQPAVKAVQMPPYPWCREGPLRAGLHAMQKEKNGLNIIINRSQSQPFLSIRGQTQVTSGAFRLRYTWLDFRRRLPCSREHKNSRSCPCARTWLVPTVAPFSKLHSAFME